MNIAIIPARGGSKRIPRKNIKEFFGKPMIAYSIEAAKASGCFDKIIVSTDDQEIANVALEYGAEVPFIRPSDISDDYATTIDVIQHAILWLENHNVTMNYICCIYATAPFITPQYIQQGLKAITENSINYAFSATSYAFPIQRAFYNDPMNGINMFYPEHINTRSQDLKEAYHDAGQFYWGTLAAFSEGKAIFSEQSKAIILPRKLVQDIDTVEDWEFAEALFSALN
ncbi:pseudaminic acid cytidylyltransferase [Colwellia sp. 6_MG-2023]|jgi:N-acylneuraminate cytidylyltransferase|uniref:pseudaminic acid cytidylyltransferase n=1 Tax=Colwellia sp. 6_MG-2023 TaxID=3062676 RepID=UPI0026E28B4C|nr:pseudaminic acid cytidylyltransferase [Colwellia sp. 6_MG-2023]MDO6488128.1 pseudaminic acid cytidylyltransferase [Colwellia sp. 6_MG-2023]